jgi:hypothetical protein
MGLIGTRSLTEEIPGINELVEEAEERRAASSPMTRCRPSASSARPAPPRRARDLRGAFSPIWALPICCCAMSTIRATATEQIAQAAEDTVPTVWPLFWAFRIMVGLGFAFIGVMAYFFYRSSFKGQTFPRWALWAAVFAIPTPWIAAELGWFVAEFGRQPWTVDGVLPTALSASHLSVADLLITLAGFMLFYSVLFVVEMGLMLKYIRKGPFQDVEETEAWEARHEHRLRTHDGKGPFAPAGAARPLPCDDPSGRKRNPCGVRHMILYELIDYDILRVIWWALLGVLLIGFALTDGFDMGVGALLPFVAKTDVERRVAINTVGPVWEGNQVWFILGGGAIFAAWPPLYAVSFSGFYLAMFVVLAAFIVRPVAFKYRSKRDSARWRKQLGLGACSPAARCPRCSSGSRSATCCWACRSTSMTC